MNYVEESSYPDILLELSRRGPPTPVPQSRPNSNSEPLEAVPGSRNTRLNAAVPRADWKEASLRQMWSPGAWLNKKVPWKEEKEPIFLGKIQAGQNVFASEGPQSWAQKLPWLCCVSDL